MDSMRIVATFYDACEEVTVNPMAVFDADDTSTLYLVDENDRALWLTGDGQWLVDREPGDHEYAERIDDVIGADGEEWESSANDGLSDYGFRLGDFDEDPRNRYALIAL